MTCLHHARLNTIADQLWLSAEFKEAKRHFEELLRHPGDNQEAIKREVDRMVALAIQQTAPAAH